MLDDRPEFSLHIAGPLPSGKPLPSIPLGPNVALSFESELNGGWSNATIGIPTDISVANREALELAFLPEPVEVVPHSHVEIRAGGAVVWEGRAVGDMVVAGEIRGIQAVGYGFKATDDDWYRPDSLEFQRSSGDILLNAIGQYAPLLKVGVFEDPGRNHFTSDYQRMSPYQMLEAIAKEGGGEQGNEWMWTVYHRTLTFVERTATVPLYTPAIDDRMPVRREYDLWSHASMFYRPSYGTMAGESDVLSSEYSNLDVVAQGITRHKLVEGGTSSDSGAAQFLRTFLERSSEPTYNISIERENWEGLELATGGERSPWLVRAGEWALIRPFGLLPIISTRFDAVTGSSDFVLGRPLRRSPNGIFRRMLEAESNVRSALDVETGMRWGR